jgi:type II secretory pathway pseudopilin PulG
MRERWKNKKGYTLVELIAVFGLTAIFLVAAALVMGVFSQTYMQINTVAQGQTVASTIITTITSELSSASDVALTGRFAADEILEATGAEKLRLYRQPGTDSSKDSDWAVYYSDYHHYSVKLSVVNGYLQLEYEGLSDADDKALEQASVWKLGENVYNGFLIEELKLEQLQDAANQLTNRLKVTLTLKNEKTGTTYSMNRSFACYNLTAEQIQLPTAVS